MNEVLQKIGAIGIVPVVKIDNAKHAVPLAKALCEGGLPCAEITFRTDAAEESIRAITGAYPEMLVGAGTVLTTEQVDKAVAAGAKFIVSPGLSPKIVKYCIEKGIPVAPGVSNATDIELAIEFGLYVVKFFPAEQAGGLAMIKALTAPYTSMKFMPTGGISAKNLNDYLGYPKVLACGGSWMVQSDLIVAEEFDKIRDLTREAVQTMLGLAIGHVGINTNDAAEAEGVTDAFRDVFGFAKRETKVSFFAGTAVEIMKYKGLGDNGHISIETNYLHRAILYFEGRGIEFDHDSAKYDDKGNMTIIYLKRDFGGFRVHLAQRK